MDTTTFFQQRHYRINKLLLSLAGIWPFQTSLDSLAILSVNVLIGGTLIIPQLCALAKLRNDMDAMFECLPPIIVFVGCVIKAVNSMYNNKKIQVLLKRMMTARESLRSVPEKEILEKYAERGRNLSIIYSGMMYSCAVLFVVIPYLKRILRDKDSTEMQPDELPFRVEYFVDLNKYYYPILLHSAVSIVIYITIISAVDITFFVFVEHACGLLSAVGYRLERVVENCDAETNFSSGIAEDRVYDNVVYCVKKHQEAIEFVNVLESTYTTSFLLQLGFNMILISITAIEATRDVTNIDSTIRYGSYIIGQMIHLFFETWQGQLIMEHSGNIRKCAYNGGWHRTSLRCKKLLCMVMMRGCTLSMLTAGKVIVMSLQSFGAVVRTSMSYYTVLRSLQ